jgi:NADPH2:quinone reductase
VRQGNYARLPTLPFTPGNEGAGIVEAVGTVRHWAATIMTTYSYRFTVTQEVTTVATGQRVYLSGCVSGTYAQYASCEFNHIRPLPDNVSFEAGAAVAIAYRTAYRALFQVQIEYLASRRVSYGHMSNSDPLHKPVTLF